MSYDGLSQVLLVEKAQKGNQEALSILIHQHRMKMLQWANKIVRNSAKAEDIVQDALIQTLHNIGSLEDPQKFLPWLRSIVRNQSLMALRSSGARLESPVDDASLDEIGIASHNQKNDPYTYTFASQVLSEVEARIEGLGKREQAVMRLHVLEGHSTSETAERLGINSSAVYTALSRARKKLMDFRFSDEVEKYISSRRRRGKPDIGGAVSVRYYSYASAYDTLTSMMMITAVALGNKQLTMTDIMASTGHAFRFHATEDLGISGPYLYDWTSSVLSGFENLGMSAKVHGGPGHQLKQPDAFTACLEDIFHALEQGIPVIAWGLNNAEFGLITGFNDKKKCWTITDTSTSGKELPYTKLGRTHPSMDWFVAIPQKPIKRVRYTNPVASMLLRGVNNIRGTDKTGNDFSLSGAATYQKWIGSFNRQRAIEPLSVAYNLAVLGESRLHARKFLNQLIDHRMVDSLLPESVLSPLTHSAQLFLSVSEKIQAVTKMFPLPFSADPTAPGPADRAALLLSKASKEEEEAANALEEAAWIINQKTTY
ncbi:RNA polymerase sigma factor [Sutcliffiella cohnii]